MKNILLKFKNIHFIVIILSSLLVLTTFVLLIIGEINMLYPKELNEFPDSNLKEYTSLPETQKKLKLVSEMPNIPNDFLLIDFKERALGFTELVFSTTLTDTQNYLPLFRISIAGEKRIGVLPAYVGLKDDPKNPDRLPNAYQNGQSEAVTFINAVLGASLMGIDMSDVYGENYVSMCLQYINGEGVLTNWLGMASSRCSMWYMQFSTLQLFALSDLYPSLTDLQKAVRVISDKYYQALVVLGGGTKSGINFEIQSFDFQRMIPVKQMDGQGSWSEADSSVTVGLMMYYAYRFYGDNKFLESALWCADYIDRYQGNPQYEIAYTYAPYFLAMLNAEVGTNYSITKHFEKVLSTTSDARSLWGYTNGTINGAGLYAVCASGEPFYWYMNTVEGAASFIPTVIYDQSFARDIGKYVLNALNSSRYFFNDGPLAGKYSVNPGQGWDNVWDSPYSKYVPFEALHYTTKNFSAHVRNSIVSPSATLTLAGDPVMLGNWAFRTDYSLYSGAATAKFGATISETNVLGIVQIDVSKLDYMRYDSKYQTYLYYNPYMESKTIEIDLGYRYYDLYDSVSDTKILKNATGRVSFDIGADSAIVLVLSERNSIRRVVGSKIYLNNTFVGYRKI
jgi:hypothetical protein